LQAKQFRVSEKAGQDIVRFMTDAAGDERDRAGLNKTNRPGKTFAADSSVRLSGLNILICREFTFP
jgi:hypothetical protein